MALAESRAASRRTHRQLWGREKMKFEPLRQTKDLAGASEGNQTATRALANTETADTYAKRITRRVLLFSLLAQIFPKRERRHGPYLSFLSQSAFFFRRLCGAAAMRTKLQAFLLPRDDVSQGTGFSERYGLQRLRENHAG
jgi:hypothetical protein